ncbi:magnesium transporter NIPA-domain-containing protein [Chaetomium fimeti]|uniref:Magnesium transporter NIPA-domain-containing protein n=1 Tax=Chaetomium fimeti TaxID=1854472 RepID=A0AAE0HKM8_9PEZI|nr:magnesium transporter NIPA-domain-containing protein [Chaetomium fimeti]
MGLIGGISPGGSIALGIIVGLLSTSVQSLGLTLQRKSHILEDEKAPYDVRRPPYRRRRWQLGMGMFIISNIVGSSVQISTLPLPVLSTLQASGLVFNSICATLILGEPFTRWSLWGTLLVCGGAVLIAIFGAIPSPAHKLSELLDLLGRRPFVLWMSFQAVFVIGLAIATELVSHFTTLMQDPRFRLARGFSYGCISGTLSAHSLLVAKSAVELIVRTIADGDNQFVHWQSWMLVLSLVTLALTQLYYLHRGLKLVSTSVLYPLIFCIYNIIAILDGLIYFRQTDLINPLRACLITLGTVILLTGVLALSWRLSDEQHTPGVGQSTLAPGLGLIEDTDGEEDGEEVSLRSALLGENEGASSTESNYQTFALPESPDVSMAPAGSESQRQSPMTRSTRAASSRWAERAEIWDELEDRSTPEPASPALSRRRSTTLPGHRHSLSFATRRGTTESRHLVPGEAAEEAEPLMPSQRVNFKKRRKSTGFPGFTARKSTARQSSGGFQSLARNVFGLKWWGNKSRPTGVADSPSAGSASWAVAPTRREDLEAGLAGSSSEERPPPVSDPRPSQGPGPSRTRQDDSPV